MVEESVLRKVRKALSLAENNPSQHEAETAMLRAQEMMAKHGLNISQIGEEKEEKEVDKQDLTKMTKLQLWEKALSGVIAANFRCTNYITKGRGTSKLVILGIKEDVEIAKEVFSYAKEVAVQLAKQYCKENGVKGPAAIKASKNEFLMGFVAGLRERFKEQVEEQEWGLVLVKDQLVIKEEEKLHLRPSGYRSRARGGDQEAKAKGFEAGKNFNHSQKTIK